MIVEGYIEMYYAADSGAVTLLFSGREPIILRDRSNISRLTIDLCDVNNKLDRRLAEDVRRRQEPEENVHGAKA